METMITKDENYRILERISEEVSRDFPDIDPQDVFSSLYERLYTLKMAHLEVRDVGVRAWLRVEAIEIAWKIRTEQLQVSAQYSYRYPDVMRIMETVFDREDWPSGYTPEDARVHESDRMAPLEVRMDASYVFSQMPESYRNVLISRYYDKVIPRKGSWEGDLLETALREMTARMNTFRGWV